MFVFRCFIIGFIVVAWSSVTHAEQLTISTIDIVELRDKLCHTGQTRSCELAVMVRTCQTGGLIHCLQSHRQMSSIGQNDRILELIDRK